MCSQKAWSIQASRETIPTPAHRSWKRGTHKFPDQVFLGRLANSYVNSLLLAFSLFFEEWSPFFQIKSGNSEAPTTLDAEQHQAARFESKRQKALLGKRDAKLDRLLFAYFWSTKYEFLPNSSWNIASFSEAQLRDDEQNRKHKRCMEFKSSCTN